MSLLNVRDLRVGFGRDPKANEVVKGASFSLEPGETLAIVGESGSGKSVTALSLNRLVDFGGGKITGGSIALELGDGSSLDVANAAEHDMVDIRGRDIGIIFQEPMTSLNPVHTVGAQIAEAFELNRGLTGSAARTAAREALERVRIPDAASRLGYYPHQLSGGMRQRVMIAMALASIPRLLIADEPTTALDVTVQAQIMGLLAELKQQRNMGLILITHDMGVVADVADRISVMYAGRIVEEAPVYDIYGRPAHPYTKALLASIPRLDLKGQELSAIRGLPPMLTRIPSGCAFHPRCTYAQDVCKE